MFCIKGGVNCFTVLNISMQRIDLLAIQQKSLDRALFLYIFIHEIRSSGVKASITIVHIRKFYKMLQSIIRLRFFFRIAKRSILWRATSIVHLSDFKSKSLYELI